MSSFANFVTRAFRLLREEQPLAFDRLQSALADQRIAMRVDGEDFVLDADAHGPLVDTDARGVAMPLVATTRRTLHALVTGAITLERALEIDALHLRGALPALLGIEQTLFTFVRGAIACPGFPALVDDLAAQTTTREHDG